MKKTLLIFLLFCAFNTKAQNLILNGSFEDNNISGCAGSFSFTANILPNVTNYNSGVMNLSKDSCLYICNSITTYWGGSRRKLVSTQIR